MPRHMVVEGSCIAFSMKTFLETAPVEDANSASSWRTANTWKRAGPYAFLGQGDKPARACTCTAVRVPLQCILAPADTPIPQAAVAAAEGASGCVTRTSTTTNGRPGRYRRMSPRWGSRWERGGSCAVPLAPPEWAAAA